MSCNTVFRRAKRNCLTQNRSPNAENGPIAGTVSYFFLSSPMVTVRSVLSKSVFNASQKFDGLLTRPQMGNLREMTLGLLLGESSHLSTIGGAVAGEITPRKNIERYSRTLQRIDTAACMKQHIACVAQQFRTEPVLLLWDGGDMQKRHAKKMKYVCNTVDGSEGHTPGRGYPTFACVAYGLETKKQLPLCHHLYSTVDPAFKSPWVEQQRCFGWMDPVFTSPSDRIVVSDRGNDDEKQFLYYLQDIQCSFLTRINTGKTSRHLRVVRRGEIADDAISVQEIVSQMKGAAGAAKKWKNKKLKKTLTSSITFQEVRLPDHPTIPLFLVLLYTDGFKDPIVLLTDIKVADAEKAWTVFFWYKKRWEVENFFRAIKQEFDAEGFLIRSFPAIRAFAFVQMLAFYVLRTLHAAAQEIFVGLFSAFTAFCAKWQRAKKSHMDLLHWLRAEWKRDAVTGVISYRSCARLLRRTLCGKPEKPEQDFLPAQKW